jgi:hypothetical protein
MTEIDMVRCCLYPNEGKSITTQRLGKRFVDYITVLRQAIVLAS